MSKAVILSIHPKRAEKIYSGEKEVEWRKTIPTEATPGMPVLLYETAPVCKVTGLFFWIGKETLKIREPDFDGQEIHSVAQRLIDAGCVPLEDLKKYQGANGQIYAWNVRGKMKFPKPHQLSDYGLSRAPQSWQYITIKETQK